MNAPNGMIALQNLYADAEKLGEQLARMLLATDFSSDVKDAWLEIIPSMNLTQIARFEQILRAHLQKQTQEDLSDMLLAINIENTKYKLVRAAEDHKALVALDDLEAKLDTLERAGGKKSE